MDHIHHLLAKNAIIPGVLPRLGNCQMAEPTAMDACCTEISIQYRGKKAAIPPHTSKEWNFAETQVLFFGLSKYDDLSNELSYLQNGICENVLCSFTCRDKKVIAMAATITRISQSAGCSPATVSRVLNNSGPVSPVTREAVLRHARELGYVKPSAPKGRNQSEVSSRIAGRAVEVVMHWRDPIERVKVGSDGVSVDSLEPFQDRRYFTSGYHLTNSFHREIINGIVGELKRWGIKAVVEVASDLSSEPFLKDLNAPDKLGVLLLGELTDGVGPFCDNCSHPLVLVDIMQDGWRDVVTIDNFGGSRAAVKHLLELGHRDIGFSGWVGNPAFQDRKAGYIATLFQLGLPCKPEWCCEETVHIEEKAVELADLLASRNRPTALFCSNDFQALSAIKAASKVGLSVPKDLSIVGFDDIELAQFTTPALTTVHVPVAQLGRLAARQLVISSEGVGSEKLMGALGSDTRVRTQLVRRESTARLEL